MINTRLYLYVYLRYTYTYMSTSVIRVLMKIYYNTHIYLQDYYFYNYMEILHKQSYKPNV